MESCLCKPAVRRVSSPLLEVGPLYLYGRVDGARFKRLTVDTASELLDWREVFLGRLRRTSRCLALLEKIVEQPKQNIHHLEQVVALGPEMKDRYLRR